MPQQPDVAVRSTAPHTCVLWPGRPLPFCRCRGQPCDFTAPLGALFHKVGLCYSHRTSPNMEGLVGLLLLLLLLLAQNAGHFRLAAAAWLLPACSAMPRAHSPASTPTPTCRIPPLQVTLIPEVGAPAAAAATPAAKAKRTPRASRQRAAAAAASSPEHTADERDGEDNDAATPKVAPASARRRARRRTAAAHE